MTAGNMTAPPLSSLSGDPMLIAGERFETGLQCRA
jgi:hypothetical protein